MVEGENTTRRQMSPLHRILEWGIEGCTATAELRLSTLNYAPQFFGVEAHPDRGFWGENAFERYECHR